MCDGGGGRGGGRGRAGGGAERVRAETKPVRGVFLRQRQGASRFCASVSERALCEKTEIRVGKLNVQRLVIVFRSLFVRFHAFFCGKKRRKLEPIMPCVAAASSTRV